MSDDKQLSLLGHFKELRSRLLRIIIALGIAVVVSIYFAQYVIEFFKQPVPGISLVYTEITEMLGVYFKVSLIMAMIITLPFIAHQVISFVKPALTKSEKKYLYMFLPALLIFFFGGAVFAYYILIPPAFTFLVTFGSDLAQPMIKIGNYISVLTNLLFWIGICFEIPLIMFFLTKIGVVTPEWLSKYRKLFYIFAFILGAMITPTFDPVNQTLVALPVIVLYEIGVLLSKMARKHRTVP